MKKIFYWVALISAFILGFITNEYRHQHLESNKVIAGNFNQSIQTESPSGQMDISNQNREFPTNKTSHEFSWDRLRELINHQEYTEAIEQLKQYLQTHPKDAQAWYWLASSYQSQGKLTLAVETWLIYLNYEVDSERIHQTVANLKRLLQQLVQSPVLDENNPGWLATQMNQLLDISVNDTQLHLMLAQLHLNKGDDYQAQYHALMAANDPLTQQQAEKILSQLNGDISDEPMELPLTRFGEQFIVTVRIDNIPANLLLDTGASISGVTNRYTRKYPSLVKNTKPIRLNTASGTRDSYLFTVDSLHMGDARFSQHMLAVLPMDEVTEFDGLLGIDILGKFDFVIDQNNSTLKLSPRNP